MFGVAVAGSENLLAVGAFPREFPAYRAGVVYVFERVDGAWRETQKLVAPDFHEEAWFGFPLALEGSTLLVSASHDDTAAEQAGAVYLYEREGSAFAYRRKIIPGDRRDGGWFGWGIDLDQGRVAVGAPGDVNAGVRGVVYVYEPRAEPWYEVHGDYEVTLEVEDASGNRATDSVSFTIESPPTGPRGGHDSASGDEPGS